MRVFAFFKNHLELLFWTPALVVLYFLPVSAPQTSLCVFSLLGIGHCPGCGIGHAIHYALHFDITASFHAHFMGIPAVIIIFIRIKQLIFQITPAYEAKPDHPDTFH